MGAPASSDFGGVLVYDEFDRDGEAEVRINTEWCWLRREEATALRDHLSTLLGDAPAAKAETVAVEVGREYRLLPGSKYAEGGDTLFDQDVTRVRVVRGRDSDGDVLALALDGGDRGTALHVDSKYLAPLDDPAPGSDLAAVAASAHAVAATLMSDRRYPASFATAFKRFAEDLDVRSHL